MMKITIVAGARPNFMKVAPIARAVDKAAAEGKPISYRLVYTGRQDDPALDASLFTDLGMEKPDAYLGVEGGSSVTVAAGIMVAFEKELTNNPAHVVLVVDDLTATMSCAIVAKKHGVKVAHLIAGTRSFDIDMPKEVNRVISDGLSDYLFTAGMLANRNLSHSGAEDEHIFHVGNILMDSLWHNRKRFICPMWFSVLGLKEGHYLLLTINRRALLKDKAQLKRLTETLIAKASDCPIVAPLHNYVADAVREVAGDAPNLHLMPPQSYLNFAYLLNNAKGVVTDSGNVAEEATFLNVPCITLNSFAEHPETWKVGTNVLVGEDAEKLGKELERMLQGTWKKSEIPDRWDGRTAERIVQILLQTHL